MGHSERNLSPPRGHQKAWALEGGGFLTHPFHQHVHMHMEDVTKHLGCPHGHIVGDMLERCLPSTICPVLDRMHAEQSI